MISDQNCTVCVMDTTASDISFDSNGQCNYCKNCILPSTRPNIFLDRISNLCSVCKPTKIRKKKINWSVRAKKFKWEIIDKS